jgi:hypothetical protein
MSSRFEGGETPVIDFSCDVAAGEITAWFGIPGVPITAVIPFSQLPSSNSAAVQSTHISEIEIASPFVSRSHRIVLISKLKLVVLKNEKCYSFMHDK